MSTHLYGPFLRVFAWFCIIFLGKSSPNINASQNLILTLFLFNCSELGKEMRKEIDIWVPTVSQPSCSMFCMYSVISVWEVGLHFSSVHSPWAHNIFFAYVCAFDWKVLPHFTCLWKSFSAILILPKYWLFLQSFSTGLSASPRTLWVFLIKLCSQITTAVYANVSLVLNSERQILCCPPWHPQGLTQSVA